MRAVRFACVWVLLAAVATNGSSSELERLPTLTGVQYHRLQSKAAEHSYDVFVRLPPGYGEDEKSSFPAVYLLDGGVTFPLLAGYQRYLELSKEVPAAILVGLSYGARDWQGGNNRSHDFTAPSAERDFWGGAADFQKMLSEELLPWVEGRFRADPERRVIFGQSLGGQFVLFTAQTRPQLFYGHIASNPALHRNLEFFLRPLPERAAASPRPGLFVSSGSEDDERFRKPALKWMEHWRAVEALPWRLQAVTLDGETHFSAAPAAYRWGMVHVFSDGPAGD